MIILSKFPFRLFCLLFLLLFFLFLPTITNAVTNDFCLTKKACWHKGTSITDPIDICLTYPADSSLYYGGSCNNGTFNPYCVGGSTWKFYYPTCAQIDYPCLKNDWGDGTCNGETTCSWTTQDCNTTDSCTAAEPKLRPGLCSPSSYNDTNPSTACQISSTPYKTCCNADGTLDGNCVGGDYTGTCPAGKITVFCDANSNSGTCAAVYPAPCAACGAPACATLIPTCNGDIVCTGACNAPNDTCAPPDNGTKGSCKYTKYNGTTPCSETTAPDQSCPVDKCVLPKTCQSGVCETPVPTDASTPTPTSSTPTPTSGITPTPTLIPPPNYSCRVSLTAKSSQTADVLITETNPNLGYQTTKWLKGGSTEGYSQTLDHRYYNLSANTTYILGAERYSPLLDQWQVCSNVSVKTDSPGSWAGTCSPDGTQFTISGSQGTTWAVYPGGTCGSQPVNCLWQGENVPFTYYNLTPDQSFTWHVVSPNGDDYSLSQTCPGISSPPPPPPPYTPPTEREGGMPTYLKYQDGTVYDGFKAPSIPVYSWEDGYSAYPTASALTNLDNTLYTLSCPVSPWQSGVCNYGSQCAYRYWKKTGYSFFDVVYNSGWCESVGGCDSAKGSCFKRWVTFQFPSDFSLSASLNPASDGGGVVAYNSGGVIKMGAGGVASPAWHPVWDLIVRPPVSLTVNKTGLGQGTISTTSLSNLDTITQTREGYSLIDEEGYWIVPPDPQTLTASCSPGSTITSYSSTYGDGANGSSPRGGCGNGITACGTCTKGATSCTNTYTNAICGRNDNYWCADAKLTINCSPPTVSCGINCTTTNQTYFRTSLIKTENPRLTLTAVPDGNSRFTGWEGCHSSDPAAKSCTVYMDNNYTVTANFAPISPPETPTVTSPACSSCISTDDEGIHISWRNTDTPVAAVDISDNPSFATFYNKGVSPASTFTKAPAGFHYYDPASPATPSLGIKPKTTYYVRLYNGVAANGGHSITPATFNIPVCPIPTACPAPAWLKTSGGDVHSNR